MILLPSPPSTGNIGMGHQQETVLSSSPSDVYAHSSLSSIELEENRVGMLFVELIPAL
jgi:hypothetical protein